MIGFIPVTNKESEISRGSGIRDSYGCPLVHVDPPKTAGCAVQGRGREVDEGADLILGLPFVGEVGVGRNGAVDAQNSVLPGVFPLFDPVPASTWNCQGLGLRVEKRE